MSGMNRREFLGSGIAAGLYTAAGSRNIGLSQGHKIQPADGISAEWIRNEPLVLTGCWDDFPLFQRRLGGGPTWAEDIYKEQLSEASVKKLKDNGITLVLIHFFKGFGLEAEREHIAEARLLSKLLKQNGIRVGLYVGSSIAYETFLLEEPDAQEWFVPDSMGMPVYYGVQTFRREVYFMHPGYREYIRKVVRLGIEQLNPDLIDFDGAYATPEIFQHPLAIEDFRTYLSSKYSPPERKEIFGSSDLRYVSAPKISPLNTINDPLFQNWADFRCHQLSTYYSEMSSFIRSINPSVAVEVNPYPGMAGENMVWNQSIDYPRLVRDLDAFWTEEGDNATVTPDGILVTKIRTYKVASIMKKRLFCYTYGNVGAWGFEQDGGGLLQMAESMAYNRQCIGMVGGFRDAQHLPAGPRQYIHFFRNNFEFYNDPYPIADVALLYSFSTMAFNTERPPVSFMLSSQMLIQNRLLFDIIFDQHLVNLSKYKVLYLADQECLSDRQVELIHNFVLQGGGLVATEQSSLYTESRKRRRDFALRECFNISAPQWNGPNASETNLAGEAIRTSIGKGRVVYIPEIKPAIDKPAGVSMSSQYWKPALNQKVLRDSVLWAASNSPTVHTADSLSPYVTIELVWQKEENRLVLHVLNYDYARNGSIQNIPIGVTLPLNTKVHRMQALAPEQEDQRQSMDWTGVQTIQFTLPSVQIYAVVVLSLDRV